MKADFVCYLEFTTPSGRVVNLDVWHDPRVDHYIGIDPDAYETPEVTIDNPFTHQPITLVVERKTADNSVVIADKNNTSIPTAAEPVEDKPTGVICEWCNKKLSSQSGKTLHQKTCKKAPYTEVFAEDLQ